MSKRPIGYDEKIFRDALSLCPSPGCIGTKEISMELCSLQLSIARKKSNIKLTYLHFFIKAIAQVMAKYPQWMQSISHNTAKTPDSVPIRISVSSDYFVTPTVLMEHADKKTIEAIALELSNSAIQARLEQRELLEQLKKQRFTIPFSYFRKKLLKKLLFNPKSGPSNGEGIQITSLPKLDHMIPLKFFTSSVFGIGEVKKRVMVDAQGEIRTHLSCFVSLIMDHDRWNGENLENVINEVEGLLNNPDFYQEMISEKL